MAALWHLAASLHDTLAKQRRATLSSGVTVGLLAVALCGAGGEQRGPRECGASLVQQPAGAGRADHGVCRRSVRLRIAVYVVQPDRAGCGGEPGLRFAAGAAVAVAAFCHARLISGEAAVKSCKAADLECVDLECSMTVLKLYCFASKAA